MDLERTAKWFITFNAGVKTCFFMKVYILIDQDVTWGSEAVWKVFDSEEKAKKFLENYPCEEVKSIIIQEFEIYESNNDK